MSVIFYRIKDTLNVTLDREKPLTEYLAKSDVELVVEHAQLNIEYAILCSKIACEWNKNDSSLKEQIKHALDVANLLEKIYTDYLDAPDEVERLRKEQRLMRKWLRDSNNPVSEAPPLNASYLTVIDKKIHFITPRVNFSRLFSNRTWRLLLAIAPLTPEASEYRQTVKLVAPYVAPFFSHLSWLFFIPRITSHLIMICKHTFLPTTMGGDDKLGMLIRFKIQLLARWPDLANDIPWLIANCVSCFVLIGPLLPYSSILSISMQIYEIVQATVQYIIELRDLERQRQHYLRQRDNYPKDSEDYQKLDAYLIHIDKRVTYESQRLLIPIVNTSILLLAIILSTPIFAPGYAVLGGAIAVSSTIGSFFAREYVESKKPPNHLFQLLEQAVDRPANNVSPVSN